MARVIVKELAIVGACYLIFALAKNLTDPSPVLKAVSNGWDVLQLESALSIDIEAFIQQVISKQSHALIVAITYFYSVGMWVGLIAIAAILFLLKRKAYYELRRTFMVTMVLAAFVFAAYPLAPPRFLPGFGMTDTVSLLGLDPSPNSDSAISYNRFAAMPSLHYAWALLLMIGTFRLRAGWIKVFGVAFQAMMFIAIIATANHYVLDAVAGALLLAISIYVTRKWSQHDEVINSRIDEYVQIVRTKERSVRTRVVETQMADLRENFIAGFLIRGGHAIQPTGVASTIRKPTADSFDSVHPEFSDLSLVLR
ncbi:MAG: phosphatase PAP2 family protein [Dehalococcoidia bacterium]